jgi:hypothetical protein
MLQSMLYAPGLTLQRRGDVVDAIRLHSLVDSSHSQGCDGAFISIEDGDSNGPHACNDETIGQSESPPPGGSDHRMDRGDIE